MTFRPLACLALALAGLVASAPAPAAENAAALEAADAPDARRLRVVRRSRPAFGTDVQIMATAFTDVDARLVAAHFEAAFAEVRRVEALLDPARPESPIAKINASAGGEPVVVEPEVFTLLSEAQRLAKLTHGAFDPTFAAMDGVWRFSESDPLLPAPQEAAGDAGPARSDAGSARASEAAAPPASRAPRVPPKELIEARRALVGVDGLVLDPVARSAALRREGQRISLAGLAKGYALDRAAAVLEGRGIHNFIIAAGGDLVVRGTKGPKPWMIGIQDPRAPGHFAAFPAQPGAVMTTGDYERFFFEDGKRYHHILDPRMGYPAEGLRSVTIVAGDGLLADALSTAVFVLGPKQGLALIERLDGVEGILVAVDNRVLISKGLRESVRYRPPTDAP